MAGTAKGYDATKIEQGPGDLWLIGTAPADSATPQLTIAADGTPDATAHPGSINFGELSAGITTIITPKLEQVIPDNVDAAVMVYLAQVAMKIEASLLQYDHSLLQYVLGGSGTYAAAGGYKQITVGGCTAVVPTYCWAAISPKRATPTKFKVSVLFNGYSSGPLSLLLSKGKHTDYKITLDGLADLTRVAGRQLGVVYETL